jgi:hypothetical protein
VIRVMSRRKRRTNHDKAPTPHCTASANPSWNLMVLRFDRSAASAGVLAMARNEHEISTDLAPCLADEVHVLAANASRRTVVTCAPASGRPTTNGTCHECH